MFCGYFFGSSQNWTIFMGHFYVFKGLLLRSRYRMGDIFWAFKISFFFWGGGVLEIPEIYFG